MVPTLADRPDPGGEIATQFDPGDKPHGALEHDSDFVVQDEFRLRTGGNRFTIPPNLIQAMVRPIYGGVDIVTHSKQMLGRLLHWINLYC